MKLNAIKTKPFAYIAIAVVALMFTASDQKNAQGADISTPPSPEKTKDIAEAGFIYGLPIVMNYAVMYEYAVDKGGSQFKI